jgi:Glycoside hydrolase family 44
VTNHTPITSNDPNDANFPVDVSFQKSWVKHLTNTWGMSTNGGVGYYIMDNEHSIWFSTHQDIHPIGPTGQEIYNDITNYAFMVKSLDSNAVVLGPEEWGWSGYFNSGYDLQWSGQHNNYNQAQFPDRGTNGGMDYMPWLLNRLHQYQLNTGIRLLDYFTLHCYPQEDGVGSDAVDNATQILRNQTTRQFWDANYVDPSWINSVIDLIPRMQSWVTNYYPGTKTGITEYNWGAEDSINGATAQADILGIFGRQSLDLATRWTTPDASTPTYLAIKIYRNYNGNKSAFGDTSVSATGPNPDNVAVFGATRAADGALTIMVVSKYLSGVTPLMITVTNFTNAGLAHVWQLNASNTIAQLSDITLNNNIVNTTVPGQSITLLVIPPAPVASLLVGSARNDGQIQFLLNGQSGQTWILQYSTNLVSWLPIMTNTITNTQVNYLLPENATQGFYRARSSP